jgi:hypothetical protein
VDLSRDAREAARRFDCHQDREVPLVIEVSRDGQSYREIARKSHYFEMWAQKIAPQPARYLRLRLLREQPLQLREIEVY